MFHNELGRWLDQITCSLDASRDSFCRQDWFQKRLLSLLQSLTNLCSCTSSVQESIYSAIKGELASRLCALHTCTCYTCNTPAVAAMPSMYANGLHASVTLAHLHPPGLTSKNDA
jgi:hypothetical protein